MGVQQLANFKQDSIARYSWTQIGLTAAHFQSVKEFGEMDSESTMRIATREITQDV